MPLYISYLTRLYDWEILCVRSEDNESKGKKYMLMCNSAAKYWGRPARSNSMWWQNDQLSTYLGQIQVVTGGHKAIQLVLTAYSIGLGKGDTMSQTFLSPETLWFSGRNMPPSFHDFSEKFTEQASHQIFIYLSLLLAVSKVDYFPIFQHNCSTGLRTISRRR